ncbi:MAG: hypothetical protein OEX01_08710 [Candidatus Bathyarchaeota archaeon]|nr:hypothetical protein [Candidatus Bathyarchaeota archaeon]
MTKPKTKQTQFNASNTRVYPARTHGFGVYKGRRVVWSVRVDEKLLNQAKPVLRGWFGSDCRGVETLLAGLVAASNGQQLGGVYPSNTVEIGKLVIERNLRPRHKLVVEEEKAVEVTKVVKKRKRVYLPVDYSRYSLEELNRDLDFARANNDVVATQFLAFEIKKRLGKVVARG